MVFEDILARHPKVLFLLGDVVSLGRSRRAWASADTFLTRFRDSGIPMYAILGNHELMQRPIKGEFNFQQRFPEHKRTGYHQVVDSIAVMLLNSNFTAMTAAEIEKQKEWYVETMQRLDEDPEVLGIVVTCHHSPFTNSKLVGASLPVQNQFLPAYIKTKKAKLFFSGHAHLFEHYNYEGKDFFVIGGGGGLQHPHRRSIVKMPDLAPDYKPLFHYMILKREPGVIRLTSRRLLPDFSGFVDGKTYSIPI
jgi:3',5'-cyclic AMP phosphodiesterase CpdA